MEFRISPVMDISIKNKDTDEIVFTGKTITKQIAHNVSSTSTSISAVELKVGLKIEVREEMLKKLQNEPYIIENFKLNIVRKNRWWYSIYFDNKE